MSKETYVWCENYNEFLELMKILHSKGYKWVSGKPTLEWDPYPINSDKSNGIEIEIISDDCTIRYGFYSSSRESSSNNMSLTDFKIKEGIKMDKFTKADLEDGMIMKLRDGRFYMYFKKLNKGVRYEGFIPIADYNDDLTYNGLSSYSSGMCDIVAVYSPEDLTTLDFASQIKYSNLIWKRQKEVVMTISEIEKKLGITNLKIVKEVDE